MNIAAILKNIDNGALNEETATAIAQAFESAVDSKVSARINLEVEKALKEQDEDHAAKLKTLIEAIDEDHTNKLQKVVEAVTLNHTAKLQNVASYYQKAVNERAEKFSNKIVEEMSNYLDLYLDKIIPKEQLSEAVANTAAKQQLEQIKKIVAIDPSAINENIKGIIVQGKNKIESLQSKLNEAYKENIELNEQIKSAKASILIEQKTKGMPSSKKEFITKILCDKSPEYIKENFAYVVNMFEREEKSISKDLAKSASQEAITKDAKVSKPTVVTESTQVNPQIDESVSLYVNALKSFK